MLEKRESPMRFSAIFHVISGAKWGLMSQGQGQPDYVGVLKLLVEKGESNRVLFKLRKIPF